MFGLGLGCYHYYEGGCYHRKPIAALLETKEELDAFYLLPRINEPNGGAHFHHPTPATLVLGSKKENQKLNLFYSE